MKNISRRVFIKGMAVAAAATAASTVLAGCNFVPGTEETPVAGFAPETKTITIGEESVAVSTTSFAITADKYAKIGLTLVNECDENVEITAATVAAENKLAMSACFDNKYNTLAAVANTGDKKLIGTTLSKNVDGDKTESYTQSGYVYVALPEEWSTLTLVCILAVKEDNALVKKEVTFTFNK